MKYNIAWIAKKKYDDWKANNPIGDRFITENTYNKYKWNEKAFKEQIDNGDIKFSGTSLIVKKGNWGYLIDNNTIDVYKDLDYHLGVESSHKVIYDKNTKTVLFCKHISPDSNIDDDLLNRVATFLDELPGKSEGNHKI